MSLLIAEWAVGTSSIFQECRGTMVVWRVATTDTLASQRSLTYRYPAQTFMCWLPDSQILYIRGDKKNDRESNLAVCKYQHLNISEASKLKPSIKVIQSHPKPYTLTIHRIHGLIGRGADAGTSWLHFEDQRLETTNPWGFGTCTVESEQGDTYQGIYIPVIYIYINIYTIYIYIYYIILQWLW